MIDIKDRLVEHPNRFKLIAVPGMEGVYDLIPHPGEVTEEGTAVNKALFNDLQSDIPIGSFLAFAGNVNSDMLNAAFGKGNEDRMVGLGRQLAMYAWFKGEDKTTFPFTQLSLQNTLQECIDEPGALVEIMYSSTVQNLINTSPYAKTIYESMNTGKALAVMSGLNPDDYADLSAIVNSTTAMQTISESENVWTTIAGCPATIVDIVMSGFFSNYSAREILWDSLTASSYLLMNNVFTTWMFNNVMVEKTKDLASGEIYNFSEGKKVYLLQARTSGAYAPYMLKYTRAGGEIGPYDNTSWFDHNLELYDAQIRINNSYSRPLYVRYVPMQA